MNILYIGNHDSGGNDDEGAIHYALSELGHDVQRIREFKGHTASAVALKFKPDLLLFHKWNNVEELKNFQGVCPRVFWYFDLVDWPSDPTLAPRCQDRKNWMARVLPHVELGFCTDGDWVAKMQTAPDTDPPSYKLVWLTQGADERVVGRSNLVDLMTTPPVLLACIDKGGGQGRTGFVQWAKDLLGPKLKHFTGGIYREALRAYITKSKIVLCPDSPVTDRYWSNRVYNAAGFGGLVLHPYCTELQNHYTPQEVIYYMNRAELEAKIDFYLRHDKDVRQDIADAALERTKKEHLYRHRCQTLLDTVKARCS